MDIPSVIVVFLLFISTMHTEGTPVTSTSSPSTVQSHPHLHRHPRSTNHNIASEDSEDTSGGDGTCYGGVPVCGSAAGYPERVVHRLVTRYKRRFSPAFGTVVEPAAQARAAFRSALVAEEENLCRTRTVTVMPRSAYDSSMRRRYIVNVENHVQAVTFQTCAETKCHGSSVLDTLNVNTFCQQQYTNVRLLYLNEEEDSIEYGQFSVPSTCVCTYRKLIRL